MAVKQLHSTSDEGKVQAAYREDGTLTLRFSGALTLDHLPSVWATTVDHLQGEGPPQLIVDLSAVSNVDGAGLGLLGEIRRNTATSGGEVTFEGLKGELSNLVQLSALADPEAKILVPPKRSSWVVTLGMRTEAVRLDLRDQLVFTGELLSALGWAIRNPRSIRFRDLCLAAQKAGVDALPIILLLGFLIGMIVAVLAASVLESFGAMSMIPMILGIGMVREFAPLITAVFLAGRCGSFYAAEIGTMKITEELDALETFGLNRVRFLVVPRVLAAVLTMPMLTVFFMLSGLIGGYVICRLCGISLPLFVNAIGEHVNHIDLLAGVFKSFVFALIVSATGCLRGFQTGKGPGAVGVSTTRSLVTGVAMIVAADGLLGVVFYALGI